MKTKCNDLLELKSRKPWRYSIRASRLVYSSFRSTCLTCRPLSSMASIFNKCTDQYLVNAIVDKLARWTKGYNGNRMKIERIFRTSQLKYILAGGQEL